MELKDLLMALKNLIFTFNMFFKFLLAFAKIVTY